MREVLQLKYSYLFMIKFYVMNIEKLVLVSRAYTVLPQHVYCGCNTILISESSLNVICDVISSITFQYMGILLCDTSACYIFNIGK